MKQMIYGTNKARRALSYSNIGLIRVRFVINPFRKYSNPYIKYPTSIRQSVFCPELFLFFRQLRLKISSFDAEFNSASGTTTFRASTSPEANIRKVYHKNTVKNPIFWPKTSFLARCSPLKISSFDAEFNSASSTTTFRASINLEANICKVC